MPKKIAFGENAAKEFEYPAKSLIITTTTPDVYNPWLEYMQIRNYEIYDKVTPDPAIETIETIRKEYEGKDISAYIGLGGGSSLDVAKYAGMEMKIPKILIPTTFGTGAEMTTYCVLKFDGKKKLLQDERFLADMAVIDAYFMEGTPEAIVKNSVCDACAQATEGYDSKRGNEFTKMLCKSAFDVLYDAIMNNKPENYPFGSMLSGVGFGNASTTLGHALSYVFSNEGVPHGYSLSSCTTVAHRFNKSIFYDRFKEVIEKLKFDKLTLKAPYDQAADVVMTDKGHLDPNPLPVTKQDVVQLLKDIVDGKL